VLWAVGGRAVGGRLRSARAVRATLAVLVLVCSSSSHGRPARRSLRLRRAGGGAQASSKQGKQARSHLSCSRLSALSRAAALLMLHMSCSHALSSGYWLTASHVASMPIKKNLPLALGEKLEPARPGGRVEVESAHACPSRSRGTKRESSRSGVGCHHARSLTQARSSRRFRVGEECNALE
jgi:hypothetical protein